MKARLHSIDSPDVPNMDLKAYAPHDPSDVAIQVAARIGAYEEQGDNLFYFMIRTPKSLAREVIDSGHIFPRGYIVVTHFDFEIIWNAIAGLCRGLEAPDWEGIAEKLSRYAHWEFEDYKQVDLGKKRN
jgi:hypothetical protein